MPTHPAYDYARKIGLAISPEALAQHYGVTTDRLDFTQDPDIAAFFATHAWEARQWRPICEGIGVVYRFEPGHLRRGLRYPQDLEWIRKQTFPRPGEQKAWTFRLPLGVGLEQFPVDVFTFSHSMHASRRLHEKFKGGELLFPSDVLSEAAEQIRQITSIPRSLVEKVLQLQGCPEHMRAGELEASVVYFAREFGVEVADRALFNFSTEQLRRARDGVAAMRETFLGNVGVMAVRNAHPAVTEATARFRRRLIG